MILEGSSQPRAHSHPNSYSFSFNFTHPAPTPRSALLCSVMHYYIMLYHNITSHRICIPGPAMHNALLCGAMQGNSATLPLQLATNLHSLIIICFASLCITARCAQFIANERCSLDTFYQSADHCLSNDHRCLLSSAPLSTAARSFVCLFVRLSLPVIASAVL